MSASSDPLRALRDPLRQRLRAQRAALAPVERLAAGAAIAAQLAALPAFAGASRLAGYFACGGELPLHEVPARCRQQGTHYLLPVLGRGRVMRFARWRSGQPLAPNRYGIPEPVADEAALRGARTLDLVLLPLLAFARNGARLGSGGGFYDASFAFLRKQARPARPLLCGIAYAFQELPADDPALAPQPWDVPLDTVLTEREIIHCSEEPPCTTG